MKKYPMYGEKQNQDMNEPAEYEFLGFNGQWKTHKMVGFEFNTNNIKELNRGDFDTHRYFIGETDAGTTIIQRVKKSGVSQ